MPPPRVCEDCRRCAECDGEVPDHEWPRETLCRVCRGVDPPPPSGRTWRAIPYVEFDATNDKSLMDFGEQETRKEEIDRRLRRDPRQGSLL